MYQSCAENKLSEREREKRIGKKKKIRKKCTRIFFVGTNVKGA